MMNKRLIKYLIIGALVVLVIAQGAAAFGGTAAQDLGDGANDDNPSGVPTVIIPERYQPAGRETAQVANTVEVYFTPQDQSTSVTILFLYNTSTIARTVTIETYGLNGNVVIPSTDIGVPAGELVRVASDTVDTVSGSWQEAVLVDMTTSSVYGKLTLPPGVKVDGYVAWNNGSTYDPIDDQNTLGLRFSVDPYTIFMSAVNNNN